MPYLTKPKGRKLCPRQVEIKIHKVQQKEVKAVKKVNQQILDIKHSQQSMASGSEQQQHKGQQPSTSEKTHHIPENLPYFILEWNGRMMCSVLLNIIQGLKDCPQLQNIWDNCVK